jgi:hypothetical protein
LIELLAVEGAAELEVDVEDPLPFQTSSPIGVFEMSTSISSAVLTQRFRPLKSFIESS